MLVLVESHEIVKVEEMFAEKKRDTMLCKYFF